jgi:starvation-inducible DNA-binding protein
MGMKEIKLQNEMKTNIAINDIDRQALGLQLAKLMADEYVLYTKTRNADWNVEGPDFHNRHRFLESQYELLENFIDDIAKRIRSLGHYAPATLADFLKLTRLSEQTSNPNDSKRFMAELLVDHENIVMILRGLIIAFAEENADAGTRYFVTKLMEDHKKMAWTLRAHIN